MQSTAKDVTSYLEEVPAERHEQVGLLAADDFSLVDATILDYHCPSRLKKKEDIP
jgi:hypothetical protein